MTENEILPGAHEAQTELRFAKDFHQSETKQNLAKRRVSSQTYVIVGYEAPWKEKKITFFCRPLKLVIVGTNLTQAGEKAACNQRSVVPSGCEWRQDGEY